MILIIRVSFACVANPIRIYQVGIYYICYSSSACDEGNEGQQQAKVLVVFQVRSINSTIIGGTGTRYEVRGTRLLGTWYQNNRMKSTYKVRHVTVYRLPIRLPAKSALT